MAIDACTLLPTAAVSAFMAYAPAISPGKVIAVPASALTTLTPEEVRNAKACARQHGVKWRILRDPGTKPQAVELKPASKPKAEKRKKQPTVKARRSAAPVPLPRPAPVTLPPAAAPETAGLPPPPGFWQRLLIWLREH